MRLTDYDLSVLVFHAQGCGHCEEYVPRLRAVAEGQCVPTVLVDIGTAPVLANALGVEYTPTTVAVHNREGVVEPVRGARLDGAVPDREIQAFYKQLGCPIGGEE